MYLSKLSCYPSTFFYSSEEIPDQTLPNDLNVKYLAKYREWFSHLKFVIEKLPEAYMKVNTASCTVEEIKKGLQEDLSRIDSAIIKTAELKHLKIPVWLSVG